jgi:hypothetical protein
MKILVDEKPINVGGCLFSEWDISGNAFKCKIIGFIVPCDCPKECQFIAEGIMSNAVDREDRREEAP